MSKHDLKTRYTYLYFETLKELNPTQFEKELGQRKEEIEKDKVRQINYLKQKIKRLEESV